MFARVVLALNGLVFFAFGAVGLWDPETLADPVGYVLSTLTAFTEFRAFYGGFEIGTGLFLLVCAARPEWWRAGLTGSVLMIGGTALGRIFGFISDGERAPVLLMALSLEVTATVLSLIALRTLGAESTPVEPGTAP